MSDYSGGDRGCCQGDGKKKAPGLDGFMVEFYEVTWDFIRHEILEVMEESC